MAHFQLSIGVFISVGHQLLSCLFLCFMFLELTFMMLFQLYEETDDQTRSVDIDMFHVLGRLDSRRITNQTYDDATDMFRVLKTNTIGSPGIFKGYQYSPNPLSPVTNRHDRLSQESRV